MPKASRGGRRAQKKQSVQTTTTRSNVTYSAMSDSDAQALRDMYDSQYDADTTSALKLYTTYQGNMSDFDGNGFTMSQTMNYVLDSLEDDEDISSVTLKDLKKLGLNLDADKLETIKYVDKFMSPSFHEIGKDVQLQRGAHDDLLVNFFGIKNYENLSESDLKNKLVGAKVETTSYWSTSYDVKKNPFLGNGSGVSGGREVVYNINAKSDTKMLFGNRKQSEIILGKKQTVTFTNVRYATDKNGKQLYATPRGKGMRKQIIIDVEVG